MYHPDTAKYFQLSGKDGDRFIFDDIRGFNLESGDDLLSYSFSLKNLCAVNIRDSQNKLVARTYNKGFKAKLNIPDSSLQAQEFIAMVMYANTVENRNSHRVALAAMGEKTFY